MQMKTTMDLRFIIGVLHGYIVHDDPQLDISVASESKEDYEQSILYYKRDGGVIRYNHVAFKIKFDAPGGLGTDRQVRNKAASTYLALQYPDIITPYYRKNGKPEVRMRGFLAVQSHLRALK